MNPASANGGQLNGIVNQPRLRPPILLARHNKHAFTQRQLFQSRVHVVWPVQLQLEHDQDSTWLALVGEIPSTCPTFVPIDTKSGSNGPSRRRQRNGIFR